ncbi:hypothetical protein J6590_061688 [Homalodisca vitripennis]|nr:hypothetical protein J6590_061688 [Homalodisca vitripennis]
MFVDLPISDTTSKCTSDRKKASSTGADREPTTPRITPASDSSAFDHVPVLT